MTTLSPAGPGIGQSRRGVDGTGDSEPGVNAREPCRRGMLIIETANAELDQAYAFIHAESSRAPT